MTIKHSVICVIIACMAFILFAQPTPKFRNSDRSSFISLSGFKGEFTHSIDGRIFSHLKGSFNLPAGKDSTSICSNADTIAKTLWQIYKSSGSTFALKRISFDSQTGTCCYQQFWGEFYLERQPYYLLINYEAVSNSYTVSNQLYMQPVTISDKVLDFDTACTFFDEILFGGHHLIDLKKLPVNSVKATEVPVRSYVYNDDYLRLNLFRVISEKDTLNPHFSLQWCFHVETDFKYLLLYMDAVNGNPEGEAFALWEKRVSLQKLVNNYISITGFNGTYNIGIEGINVIIEGTFPLQSPADLNSFTLIANKLLPDYVAILKAAGLDIGLMTGTTEPVDNSEEDKVFQCKYKQLLPLTNSGYDNDPDYDISISFFPSSQTYRINANLYQEKVTIPAKIVSPQTVVEYYLYDIYKFSNDERPYKYPHRNDIPVNLINPVSLKRDYSFEDKKAGITVSLVYAYEFSNQDGFYGNLKLAWKIVPVKEGKGWYCLDALTGKGMWDTAYLADNPPARLDKKQEAKLRSEVVSAFSNDIKVDEVLFQPGEKTFWAVRGSLLNEKDDFSFNALCRSVLDSMNKLYGFEQKGFGFTKNENEYEGYEGSEGQTSFNQTFLGYDLGMQHMLFVSKGDADTTYAQGMEQDDMPLNPSAQKDSVFISTSNLITDSPVTPDFIITPITAWHIAVNDSILPMVWEKRQFLTGDIEYYQTFPFYKRSEVEPDNQDSEVYSMPTSVKLLFYPLKQDNYYGRYDDFVPIYIVVYNGDQVCWIDAATGRIINQFWVDTC